MYSETVFLPVKHRHTISTSQCERHGIILGFTYFCIYPSWFLVLRVRLSSHYCIKLSNPLFVILSCCAFLCLLALICAPVISVPFLSVDSSPVCAVHCCVCHLGPTSSHPIIFSQTLGDQDASFFL